MKLKYLIIYSFLFILLGCSRKTFKFKSGNSYKSAFIKSDSCKSSKSIDIFLKTNVVGSKNLAIVLNNGLSCNYLCGYILTKGKRLFYINWDNYQKGNHKAKELLYNLNDKKKQAHFIKEFSFIKNCKLQLKSKNFVNKEILSIYSCLHSDTLFDDYIVNEITFSNINLINSIVLYNFKKGCLVKLLFEEGKCEFEYNGNDF